VTSGAGGGGIASVRRSSPAAASVVGFGRQGHFRPRSSGGSVTILGRRFPARNDLIRLPAAASTVGRPSTTIFPAFSRRRPPLHDQRHRVSARTVLSGRPRSSCRRPASPAMPRSAPAPGTGLVGRRGCRHDHRGRHARTRCLPRRRANSIFLSFGSGGLAEDRRARRMPVAHDSAGIDLDDRDRPSPGWPNDSTGTAVLFGQHPACQRERQRLRTCNLGLRPAIPPASCSPPIGSGGHRHHDDLGPAGRPRSSASGQILDDHPPARRAQRVDGA